MCENLVVFLADSAPSEPQIELSLKPVINIKINLSMDLFQLDRDLVAIPRSTNEERIKQNIDIYDFKLTLEEIELLSKFNSNYRYNITHILCIQV